MAWFVYHVNQRSQALRRSSFVPNVTFAAQDDTAANAIAALVEGISDAQNVSVTKEVSAHNKGAGHPAGTDFGVRIVLKDANKRTQTIHLRNAGADTYDVGLAWDKLFKGLVGVAGTPAYVALSAPPKLDGSNQSVDEVVSAGIVY